MARRQFFRLAASISTAIWPDRCFSRFHHAGFTTSITTADDSSSTGSAKEDAVLPPKTVEWPLWHDDPWRNEHGQGDPVPQRHDIELARYVEKQRACREPTPPRFRSCGNRGPLVVGGAADRKQPPRPSKVGSAAMRRVIVARRGNSASATARSGRHCCKSRKRWSERSD